MVLLTEKPSLRPASCCSVEVVKGGAGHFATGFFSTSLIVNVAFLHLSRNCIASSSLSKRLGSSAKSWCSWFSTVNEKLAVIRYALVVLKLFISSSRSTMRRTATLCTRPADNDGFTFFHNKGDNS